MGIPRLTDKIVFPRPERTDASGIVAYGGDLSVDRLLEAYRQGIFPWSAPDEPLFWWCPDPRLVLVPSELKVSRSLRAVVRKGIYTIRCDTAFSAVIHACSVVDRPGEDGTWISAEVERAYTALHRLGYAHSVEAWFGDELAGGLYGVQLGRCFFGESMFSRQRDASKVALIALCQRCQAHELDLIDCQVTTEHLLSLGAREIPRTEFLGKLRGALKYPTDREFWRWPS
ncbi:MAG TPA: leucyl/phenylalanyl-tRNA--protein transferase [Isosphaeraceae bacterium]|jgi:leucyl/phenylalanyl-tRNA--protein transferase|nr:leucyl/phenylalanyl-tRNA--protein transferase [Isosphaeraceae bacterium]